MRMAPKYIQSCLIYIPLISKNRFDRFGYYSVDNKEVKTGALRDTL